MEFRILDDAQCAAREDNQDDNPQGAATAQLGAPTFVFPQIGTMSTWAQGHEGVRFSVHPAHSPLPPAMPADLSAAHTQAHRYGVHPQVATAQSALATTGVASTEENQITTRPNNDGRPARRPYRPMEMVSPFWRAVRQNPTPQELRRRVQAGMSVNYRGDAAVASNRSADIPEEDNCSIWMEGLPPNVTTQQLLGAIHDIGRVWQSHIVRPSGHHATAAAKVTFFTAAAAQRMIAKYRGGISVKGHTASVVYNRTRVAEPREPADSTRVLLISGPPSIVNVDYLTKFFDEYCQYQVDEIIHLVPGRFISVMEWRFGSFRCQAQAAFQAMNSDSRFEDVLVLFDRDPCDCEGPLEV